MIFCERRNCEYYDDGACANDNITINEDGTCTDYIQDFTDYWDKLDDIEREEFNRVYRE